MYTPRCDSRKDAAYMIKRLQKLPKPCAIYSKSDNDAAWLFNVCMDAKLRVPEDIAILGTDDNRLIVRIKQFHYPVFGTRPQNNRL